MKQPTDIGMNRTGIDMSPVDAQDLIETARSACQPARTDGQALKAFRSGYIQGAEPIGTVPVPGTLKGVAKAGLQKLTGKKPEVLIDKLGERLAFERTGTRLYEALLNKCEARRDEAGSLPLEQLREFHADEARHFGIVAEVIRQLGADPTAVTPCADTSGVAAMGLVQVLTDPRTSVTQCIHAIHIAELADNDGWQLLIDLTTALKLDDIAARFQQALVDEDRHLETIRKLMASSVLTDARAA
jgi:rubrerythrin